MSDKTLGHLARVAFMGSIGVTPRDEIIATEEAAWQAAAEAVVAASIPNTPEPDLRDAVVEAARKLNRIWPTADFGSAEWLCARDDFHEAVEALEREGE